MRVRLPLNGFTLFKMNWMYHLSVWAGSHYAVRINYLETAWFIDFSLKEKIF